MVLELWLDSNASCVVQYVLFPPYYDWGEEFSSDSDEETNPPSELDTELQMITEVWVEPQYGKVVPNESRTSYFNNKTYRQIAEAVSYFERLFKILFLYKYVFRSTRMTWNVLMCY